MTDMNTITINGYGGSWSGHVSVTLGGVTFEQQWGGSVGGGLFSGAGPDDGKIQVRPQDASQPSVSVTFYVSAENFEKAQELAKSNLGVNNYGLLTQNCVNFVDAVAAAGGIRPDEWRYEMARLGGIPGGVPIELIISHSPSIPPGTMLGEFSDSFTKCFPATTPIAISPTKTCPISDIHVGDTALAFDPAADLGRGALVPRKVVRLYRNTTEEWVKLTWTEGGEAKELIATPGHHFLDRFGSFPTIEDMLENGRATVILASGELTEVAAEEMDWRVAA